MRYAVDRNAFPFPSGVSGSTVQQVSRFRLPLSADPLPFRGFLLQHSVKRFKCKFLSDKKAGVVKPPFRAINLKGNTYFPVFPL